MISCFVPKQSYCSSVVESVLVHITFNGANELPLGPNSPQYIIQMADPSKYSDMTQITRT